MSFYNRKSSLFSSGLQTASRGYNRKINEYKGQSTNIRRHEYVAGTPDVTPTGTMAVILANEYFGVVLAKFERSFGGGADDPPTPTTGNNYQTAKVFNGSYIMNMNSTITLKNNASADPATLTIYEIALSYMDAHTLDGLRPTESCVDFITSSPNQGRVDFVPDPAPATIMLENSIKGRRFLQRYYKKIGTVTLGNQDQASSTATFTITRIPPKCRRSQTGMFFAYVFVNDSDKNDSRTLDLDYSLENNFDEIPSDNRLPYLS